MKRLWGWIVLIAVAFLPAQIARGSGILTPVNSSYQEIQIKDHHVNVVINNGFARTEVTQTFFNPNDVDLEALFSIPLPKSASLSELTITSGELEIHGEVMELGEAVQVYEEEKSKGNEAGLATKNSFLTFNFQVSPVRAQSETKTRFVYYQPLEIDTGVGRYLYPIEEGGTDELAKSFWVPNTKIEGGSFSAEIELKSAWPVEDIRIPGFENETTTDQVGEGHFKARVEVPDFKLERDLVFYYRLAQELPGRVEMLAYRDDPGKEGTFMMVVTPGIDLQPITGGTDYAFVLDTSGSMQGKLTTLARGVQQALKQMQPHDRFRLISFNTSVDELTNGWTAATPENLEAACGKLERLTPTGGTNLYEGLATGLKNLDADRAACVILVTDAVANEGLISPSDFHKLMESTDLRVFGFVLGNSGNWPLMRTITDASGGFTAFVSNADDIVGQIMLAKSKIKHECLHDVDLRIDGVRTRKTTDRVIRKVYRGQQLVIFGKYDKGGHADVTLKTRLTGEDKTFTTAFDFPEIDESHPEIERLWALNQIEQFEAQRDIGLLEAAEAKDMIRDLGIDYQLVTDYTAMVAVSDQAFSDRGIERRNQKRIAKERAAQSARANQPIANPRMDAHQPMFQHNAPRGGSARGSGSPFGGAFDPMTAALGLGLAILAILLVRRRVW